MQYEDCRGFNFALPSCQNSCTNEAGCCWLKSAASTANITTPQCACSALMRPDPASVPRPPSPPPLPAGVKNVLYVLVDDLRTDVSPYGDAAFMVTPNLQALAEAGTTFTNAYCNIAVCSPSRMSFLTGRYPSHTRTWNFINHFRQADCTEMPATAQVGKPYRSMSFGNGGAGQCCSNCDTDAAAGAGCTAWDFQPSGNGGGVCNLYTSSKGTVTRHGSIAGGTASHTRRQWTSLPQWFTNAGYFTQSTGKIFHTEEGGSGPAPYDGMGMPPLEDPQSWSAGNTSMAAVNALAPMRPCSSAPGGGDTCSVPGDTDGNPTKPGTFTFCDRSVRDDALQKLAAAAANRAATGQPFFLAVGFRKPHLPFRHPSAYDSLYPAPDAIPLAKYKTLDASVPPIAFHETSLAANPYVPMADDAAGTLRRDYYAAISWMDYNLGLVLRELESLGVRNDTAVVFHADHGWSLGEYGEWEKFTNWEHGTRVPLIISALWLQSTGTTTATATDTATGTATATAAPSVVSDLVSLIDVYPTLAELAGIPVPPDAGLDGVSRVPLLMPRGTAATATGAASGTVGAAAGAGAAGGQQQEFALSVYPRCPANLANTSMYWQNNDCLMTERAAFPFMGVSLRTPQYRYTEWLPWNTTSLLPAFNATPVGVELYNHTGDAGNSFDSPVEVYNMADKPGYAAVRAQLAAMLRAVYPY